MVDFIGSAFYFVLSLFLIYYVILKNNREVLIGSPDISYVSDASPVSDDIEFNGILFERHVYAVYGASTTIRVASYVFLPPGFGVYKGTSQSETLQLCPTGDADFDMSFRVVARDHLELCLLSPAFRRELLSFNVRWADLREIVIETPEDESTGCLVLHMDASEADQCEVLFEALLQDAILILRHFENVVDQFDHDLAGY